MTTIALDADSVTENELPPEADDTYAALLAEAFSLTPEAFLALKVGVRDVTIFLLLREIAATVSSLEARINEYEEKAKELGTPEGMQSLMDRFLGGSSGGISSLMGGFLR